MNRKDSIFESTSYYHQRFPGNCQLECERCRIFIPFFKRAKLDLRGTDWAFFDHIDDEIGPFAVVEEKPPKTLGNSEVGVRFAGKVRALDYAVSYLHTRADLPAVDSLTTPPGFQLPIPRPTVRDLARFAQATGQTIHLTHNHQDVFGFRRTEP